MIKYHKKKEKKKKQTKKVLNHQYLGQKLVEMNYDACGKYKP